MPIFWKKDYKEYNKLGYKFYIGNRRIKKAYYGSTLIYEIKKHFGEVLFTNVGLNIWDIPFEYEYVDVEVCAGQGQKRTSGGGGGGLVTCRLKVKDVKRLYCYVGGQQNGGGTPQYNASDIRFKWDSVTGDTLNDRIVTAGGGGNGGNVGGGGFWAGASAGGAGGYPNGSNSGGVNPKAGYAARGAGGATQMSPGGGAGTDGGNYSNQPGYAGTFGLGGAGPAAAGGAGWYGGGGGSYCIHRDSEHDLWEMSSGGGGGSSYADNQYCSNVIYTGNYRAGNGYIKIKEVTS